MKESGVHGVELISKDQQANNTQPAVRMSFSVRHYVVKTRYAT